MFVMTLGTRLDAVMKRSLSLDVVCHFSFLITLFEGC